MRRIWKYQVTHVTDRDMRDRVKISMPDGRVVHVGMQDRWLCIWVDIDDRMETLERTFTVRGTGYQLGPGEIHLGTVFDGPYVWHVFEEVEI